LQSLVKTPPGAWALGVTGLFGFHFFFGAVPDNPLWGLSWELCGRAVSAGTNRTV
jgi:hypothetical protein